MDLEQVRRMSMKFIMRKPLSLKRVLDLQISDPELYRLCPTEQEWRQRRKSGGGWIIMCTAASRCETKSLAAIRSIIVHVSAWSTFLLLLMGARAAATEQVSSPWENNPYPYSIVNEPLRDALINFGYNADLRIMVSPHVSGAIQARRSSGSAKNFLDDVTKAGDLDWYSDGTVIYVSAASEEQTSVVPLNGFPFDVMKKELEEQKLFDVKYRMSRQIGGSAAIVSGPPSFVTILKQAIEARVGNDRVSPAGASQDLVVLRGSQSSSMKVR